MLQKLSNGAKGGLSKFILVGFLFMAVAGLVLTDVGGFFRDGISSTSVADVGRESVPYNQFDRYLRNALNRSGITAQDAYASGQVNEILNRYIQDILFVQAAHKLGIRVSDKDVAAQLHQFVEPLQDGDTTAQQALDRFLAGQGLNEADFVNILRKNMTSGILQQALLGGSKTASGVMAQAFARYQNEVRDVTYLEFPNRDVPVAAQPTEDELKEFYELSKAEYRIPERRSFTLAILNPESVSGEIFIPDAEVQAFYDEHKDQYEIPAGKKVEQAIFETEEAAKAALNRVEGGESLQDAAGLSYRGEQIFQEETIPDVLKDAVFGTQESSVRGPVQSPLGWHVISVVGDVDVTYTAFDKVKGSIADALRREALGRETLALVDQLNDKIDAGAGFDDLLRDFKMETVSVGPVDQFGLDAANQNGLKTLAKDSADLVDLAFGLYDNDFSDVVELQDGRFALVRLDVVQEESFVAYDAVKTQLTERLLTNRRRAANQTAVSEFLNQLNDGTQTLESLAAQKGFSLKVAKDVARSDIAETQASSEIPYALKAKIFADPEGAYVMGQAVDRFYLATSQNMKLDVPDLPQDEMARAAEQRGAVQVLSTYYRALEAATPIKINQSLLQQLYGSSGN
ncbi:MAG: peptidyl-prolyl cis-trans isomerase [Rhodospirillales bacterium]|nr:peptidyl-prolyl cis-trans isomerase [Rhodospirillales bacterium]MCB9965922.1 peptidyl-prolyl cis-trans isomerase [Rhodospirillales bacterium]